MRRIVWPRWPRVDGIGMTDFSDFKTSVAEWANRQDWSPALVTSFVRMAESKFNQELRVAQMIQMDDGLIASRCAPLPPDWLAMDLVRVANENGADGFLTARYKARDEFFNQRDSHTWMYYTLVGTQIYFGGTPDPVDGTLYKLAYYGEVPVFSDTQTSWIYTKYPQLYLFAALMHAGVARRGRGAVLGQHEAARRGHDPEAQRRSPRREGLRLARHQTTPQELWMTYQYGATLRNNQVSQIQTTVGGSGSLKIFSGAEPAELRGGRPDRTARHHHAPGDLPDLVRRRDDHRRDVERRRERHRHGSELPHVRRFVGLSRPGQYDDRSGAEQHLHHDGANRHCHAFSVTARERLMPSLYGEGLWGKSLYSQSIAATGALAITQAPQAFVGAERNGRRRASRHANRPNARRGRIDIHQGNARRLSSGANLKRGWRCRFAGDYRRQPCTDPSQSDDCGGRDGSGRRYRRAQCHPGEPDARCGGFAARRRDAGRPSTRSGPRWRGVLLRCGHSRRIAGRSGSGGGGRGGQPPISAALIVVQDDQVLSSKVLILGWGPSEPCPAPVWDASEPCPPSMWTPVPPPNWELPGYVDGLGHGTVWRGGLSAFQLIALASARSARDAADVGRSTPPANVDWQETEPCDG